MSGCRIETRPGHHVLMASHTIWHWRTEGIRCMVMNYRCFHDTSISLWYPGIRYPPTTHTRHLHHSKTQNAPPSPHRAWARRDCLRWAPGVISVALLADCSAGRSSCRTGMEGAPFLLAPMPVPLRAPRRTAGAILFSKTSIFVLIPRSWARLGRPTGAGAGISLSVLRNWSDGEGRFGQIIDSRGGVWAAPQDNPQALKYTCWKEIILFGSYGGHRGGQGSPRSSRCAIRNPS